MKKVILSTLCALICVIICSCANRSTSVSSKNVIPCVNKSTVSKNIIKENTTTVTNDVSLRIIGSNSQPLSDVKIVIINADGDVIGVTTSDKKGEAHKTLTVPIDKRYYQSAPDGLGPRGTVTAMVYKEGYREQVIFEIPVSQADYLQEVRLNPVVAGERNEPDVQCGSSHHLEIISLTDKYSEYFKK